MAFTEDQINNLKLLLGVQSEGYKNSVDLLHEEIKIMKKEFISEINELKKSLEFSQYTIDDLQKKLHKLENESSVQNNQLKSLQNLQQQLNKQEDYSRRTNIKIDGIEGNQKETYEQTIVKVQDFLKSKLELDNIDINMAHRLPSSNNAANHRPRTIIARLSRLSDRNNILRNTWKLRNTGYWINEDLCDETIKQRKEQKPQLDAARNSGKIAYFRGSKLIVKSKPNTAAGTSDLPVTPHKKPLSPNVFSPKNLANKNTSSQKVPNQSNDLPSPGRSLRPRLLSQSKNNKT